MKEARKQIVGASQWHLVRMTSLEKTKNQMMDGLLVGIKIQPQRMQEVLVETSLVGAKNPVKWVEPLVGTTRSPRKSQKGTPLHGIANLQQSNKMEVEKIKMIHGVVKKLLMWVHLQDGVKVIH